MTGKGHTVHKRQSSGSAQSPGILKHKDPYKDPEDNTGVLSPARICGHCPGGGRASLYMDGSHCLIQIARNLM
ncbi:rCG55749, partial [Rattus norvegicus]